MSDAAVTEVRPHDSLLHVVVLKRALDDTSTNQLVEDVEDAAVQTPGRPIVLDLSSVKFAPSVALGSLVQLSKSFSLDRRRFVLIGVDRRVMDSIRVTQLDKVLEIRRTLDQVTE